MYLQPVPLMCALNYHLATCNCGSSMHTLDHTEEEQESSVEQESRMSLTFFLSKASPGASHPILDFYFELVPLC
jgi:hypothetical protein